MGAVAAPTDTVELTVPDLGPGSDRAVVVSWSKRVGDPVAVDEPICRLAVGELEFEVHSTADGELSRIYAEQGARVLESTALAQVLVPVVDPAPEPPDSTTSDSLESAPDDALDSADEADAAPTPNVETIEAGPLDPEFAPVDTNPRPVEIPSQPLEEPGVTDAFPAEPEPPAAEPQAPPAEPPAPPPETEAYSPQPQAPAIEAEPVPTEPEPAGSPDAQATMPTGDDVDWSGWISPVVQMLAEEHGVDLAEVRGTGVGGRIRKRDVLKHADPRQHGA